MISEFPETKLSTNHDCGIEINLNYRNKYKKIQKDQKLFAAIRFDAKLRVI